MAAPISRFKIERERWTIEETLLSNDAKHKGAQGMGELALSIGPQHFPHFQWMQAHAIADLLEAVADGSEGGSVKTADGEIEVLRGPIRPGRDFDALIGGMMLSSDEARQLAADIRAPLAMRPAA